jgi:uncharacterized protein DUF6625
VLKKTFIQCLFGQPFPWTEQYFLNFRRLEASGWYLKVFTPNPLPSGGNIEVIPMALADYDALVRKHVGVDPKNFLSARGVPNKLTSDHYPAQGLIFQDYLKDTDYIGITNWDCCYGRLPKFLPDSELEKYEIWSDDPSGFNGIFTLMANGERALNLFREVQHWEHYFTTPEPCAFDEIRFSEALRKADAEGRIAWGHPEHFPMHSYDRLVMHQPNPRLYFEDDGALIEWYEDRVHLPSTKRHYGREIFLYHFSRTKRWPIGPKPA